MYKTEEFTRLRLWDCGQDMSITLADVKMFFQS